MSQKENFYEISLMEIFFKSFKVREAYHEKQETHAHAMRSANDYIEAFCNPQRVHSASVYVSPTEFEKLLMLK